VEIKKCSVCGICKNLKMGWTNAWYCSENCERRSVTSLHSSMPGAGICRSLPTHISNEIRNRWVDE